MSECLNNTSVVGCFNNGLVNIPVVIHYTFDNLGAPQVRVTDGITGDVVAAATSANTTPGACPIASPDVEFLELCDVQANGTVVEFIRRNVTVFDQAANPVSTVTDLQADLLTPYVVTGTVKACGDCPPLAARGLLTTW